MALARRKAAYLQALSEDAAERQRIDSELQQYGLQYKNGASTKTRSTSRSRSNANGASDSNNLQTNIKVVAASTNGSSNKRNERSSSRPQAATRPSPNRMGPPEAAVTRSSQSKGHAPMVVVKEEPMSSRSSSRSRDRVTVKAEVETASEVEKFSMLNGGQVTATGKVASQSASSNRNRAQAQIYSATMSAGGVIEDGLNGALSSLGTSIIVQNRRKSVSK